MGFSLETTNYKLGQYAGTDKPNYTTDYNENMAKIDAALKAVSDAGGAANTDLEDTKDRVSALETNVAKNTEDIASVTAAAAQNARDIVSANSEIEALQTKDTELKGDITNVENQLETISNNTRENTRNIEANKTKNDEQDIKIEANSNDITEIKRQLSEMTSEVDGVTSKVELIEKNTLFNGANIHKISFAYSDLTIPAYESKTIIGPNIASLIGNNRDSGNCIVTAAYADNYNESKLLCVGAMLAAPPTYAENNIRLMVTLFRNDPTALNSGTGNITFNLIAFNHDFSE